MSLKPFREIPKTLVEWERWMRSQTILVEDELTITESQVSDLGPYVTTVQIMSGEGTPEANISAPVGTLYTRTDGGTSTTLYVKETGTNNTGWVAK